MPALAKAPAVASATAPALDLDARRAARLEKSGPKLIRQGGRDWLFKSELPMQVVTAFAAGDLPAAFAQILVDPAEAAAFLAAGDLSQEDFKAVMSDVYGLDLGESLPSTSS